MIVPFHRDTFALLERQPQPSATASGTLDEAERRLNLRLPPSVREWYACDDALVLLAEHSNADPPIPVGEFATVESSVGRLLPIRHENQGVCTWAILLDSSDDPPVYIDVDSGGKRWERLSDRFSNYVYTNIWDYRLVLNRPAVVQALTGPLSPEALAFLSRSLAEGPRTFGWPGSVQYRFAGDRRGILIWSAADSADWWVGAADADALKAALRDVWNLDTVGEDFYTGSELGEEVLADLKAEPL